MKYLFAFLVISSVQILFIAAFVVFAASIGVAALMGKLTQSKDSGLNSRL